MGEEDAGHAPVDGGERIGPRRSQADVGPGSRESGKPARDLAVVLSVWLAVAATVVMIALPNLSAPGLYYDEAGTAGLAKDLMKGRVSGTHMPGTETVNLFGRPFPLFVQWYFGAVKPWLMIPSFLLFDPTVPVLRLTSLFWYLAGLLLFMLWTRKLLGLSAALLAAPILALDPSLFFPAVVDWGPVIPGFLCRLAGYYFLLCWWRKRKMRDGLLGAFACGLGFFAKIDFAVILGGCGIAAVAVYGKEILATCRNSPRNCALCCLCFLLGASPMALRVSNMVGEAFRSTGPNPNRALEFQERLNTACAMYDGSYFFRVMNVGRLNMVTSATRDRDTMFLRACPVRSLFGWMVIGSSVLLAAGFLRRRGDRVERQRSAFLLLSAVLITVGVILLPRAWGLHHALLVYPFPHLIVTAAIVATWGKSWSRQSLVAWIRRTLAIAIASAVIAGHVLVLWETQRLIAATGGRGHWSDSLATFCHDVKDEPDVSIVSLDWGFNEQLLFLCDNRRLSEPIYYGSKGPGPVTSKSIYLFHPREYTVSSLGWQFYQTLAQTQPRNLLIRPYKDRQGNVVFYAMRVRQEHGGL